MADGYRGTSHDQDVRWRSKEKKLLQTMKFPEIYSQRVDMRKVEASVLRPWIAGRVNALLGFEDEVVIEYANGLLEDAAEPMIDPKKMQISLTGFLEKNTIKFMEELWALLLSAQASPVGVPAEFIEQKKIEMRERQEKGSQAIVKREDEVAQFHSDQKRMDAIRSRERDGRQSLPTQAEALAKDGGRPKPSRFDQRPNDSNRRDFPDRRNDNGRNDRREAPGDHRPPSRRSPSPRRNLRSPPRREPPRRNDSRERYRSRSRDRYRSRSRSPPRRPARRSYSRSPSPPPRKTRGRDLSKSPSRSRTISRSRSPPRKRQRDYSRSVSPPPSARRDSRDKGADSKKELNSPPPPPPGGPPKRYSGPSRGYNSRPRRSPSYSHSPPQRRRQARSRSRTPPRRQRSRSRSRSVGTPRRRSLSRTPPPKNTVRATSPSRSPSPKGERPVINIKGAASKSQMDIDTTDRSALLKEKVLKEKAVHSRRANNNE